MSRLTRPGARFVVEAVLIVLTALVAGLAHLGAWGIAAAAFVVWLAAAVVEYSLSHRRRGAVPSAAAVAEARARAGRSARAAESARPSA